MDTPMDADLADDRRADDKAPVPWWQAHPDRWERELAEFEAAGATVTRVKRDLEPIFAGIYLDEVQVSVLWPISAEEALALEVLYPPQYPWFPPQVSAPGAHWLTRHRTPGDAGWLCLAPDPDAWHPRRTAADLLTTQLPAIIAVARGDHTSVEETPEVEGARIALGSAGVMGMVADRERWTPPVDVDSGVAEVSVGLGPRNVLVTLLRVGDDAGRDVDGADPERSTGTSNVWHTAPWVSQSDLRIVPWVRLSEELTDTSVGTPVKLWTTVREQLPPLRRPRDRKGEMVLALVRDEIAPRTLGWRWLALMRTELRLDPVWWALDEPADREALTARIPGFTRLAEKSVAVIGAGALGGPIVTGLARLGLGAVTIIDGATVRAATVCRQLGMPHVGSMKALVVEAAAREHNPYLRTVARTVDIGMASAEAAAAQESLADADLVIDAAANSAVSRWLALGPAPSRAVVNVSATWGAWGGAVVRLPATGGGCWACLELSRADRTLPWPPNADGEPVADGCSAPTYPGAYTDLADLAHQAVRIAADELLGCSGVWPDVSVLSLRDANGRPSLPSWRDAALTIHPDCRRHGTR